MEAKSLLGILDRCDTAGVFQTKRSWYASSSVSHQHRADLVRQISCLKRLLQKGRPPSACSPVGLLGHTGADLRGPVALVLRSVCSPITADREAITAGTNTCIEIQLAESGLI